MIQNSDINVGPANYKHLASDQLLVTSIFYTVQGEGPLAGSPAVFIRLAGCNRGRKEDMGCAFCDTAFQYSRGKVMTFTQAEQEMYGALRSTPAIKPLVVITGGEPMMQANLSSFCFFLSKYSGWENIQIESNGDRLVAGLPPEVVLVVSPKVSRVSTGCDDDAPVYAYRVPNQAVLDRVSCFKFVVDADPASPYHRPPSWADTCPRPVYVSPLTVYLRPVDHDEVANAWNHRMIDIPRTRANYAHAASLAMLHGYRVSIQQHLFYGLP